MAATVNVTAAAAAGSKHSAPKLKPALSLALLLAMAVLILAAGRVPGCEAQACAEAATKGLVNMMSAVSTACSLIGTASGAKECCRQIMGGEECVNEVCLYLLAAPAVAEVNEGVLPAAVVWLTCGCHVTSADEAATASSP